MRALFRPPFASNAFIAVAISTVLVLLPPVLVGYANVEYFVVDIGKILELFVLLWLLSIAAVIFLLHVSGKHSASVALVLLFLALVGLLESQVFTPLTPLLVDGNNAEIEINPFVVAGELVTFLALAVFFFLAKEKILRNRDTVANVISIWAFLLMGVALISAPRESEPNRGAIKNHLAISSDFNVFHIMTDSLQSDVFAEILEEDENLKSSFAGFVHFADHSGYSNWTTMSLVSMFGERSLFDIEKPANEEYLDTISKVMAENSFVTDLQDEGFNVSAVQPGRVFCEKVQYPCAQIGRFTEELTEYVADTSERQANLSLSSFKPKTVHAQLADLGLYRIVPTVLKPRLYNRGSWFLSNFVNPASGGNTPISFANMRQTEVEIYLSVSLLDFMSENIASVTDQPSYFFLHLYPPHRPFILDKNCELNDQVGRAGFNATGENEWEQYKKQSTCIVRKLAAFLDALKANGLYEKSAVVLQSDTGLGVVSPKVKNPDLKVSEDQLSNLSPARLAAYANPALAIKPARSHDGFLVSLQPTHHFDTARLLSLVATQREITSDELATIPIEDRDRQFVTSDAVRTATTELLNQRYRIRGKVKDIKNWEYLGAFSGGERVTEYNEVTLNGIQTELIMSTADDRGKGLSNYTIRLDVDATGGLAPLLYRVYDLDQNNNLRELHPYQEGSVFEIDVPTDRYKRCTSDLFVIVRDNIKPKIEPRIELAVELTGLEGC